MPAPDDWTPSVVLEWLEAQVNKWKDLGLVSEVDVTNSELTHLISFYPTYGKSRMTIQIS